jgi:hypothetical protein
MVSKENARAFVTYLFANGNGRRLDLLYPHKTQKETSLWNGTFQGENNSFKFQMNYARVHAGT